MTVGINDLGRRGAGELFFVANGNDVFPVDQGGTILDTLVWGVDGGVVNI